MEILPGKIPKTFFRYDWDGKYVTDPTLQVFIVVTSVGVSVLFFILPETNGVPLEEMAKIFGNDDQVAVYLEDIHVDQETHEVVVKGHEGSGIAEVPEPNDGGSNNRQVEKPENAHSENLVA